MDQKTPSTHQKALRINLDTDKYGTFAEIGAGQEVARWFFRVGGAAGTVAKTMSAYDMEFSDAIYGAAQRYVSQDRLLAMLDHEYRLLDERLKSKRTESSQFFVFADTVAAASYAKRGPGHGWLGMRFPAEPGSQPSQIVIHVRLLDADNVHQQEAVGNPGGEDFEMNLIDLLHKGEIDDKDFLDRVDTLASLGRTVLVSRYARFFTLAGYLFPHTPQRRIAMVLGIPSLQAIFEEKYYDDLGGGILESLGRLFKNDLKFLIYPLKDPKTGELINAKNLKVSPHLKHLYAYLLENGFIEDLPDYNEEYLPIFPGDVLEKIQSGDRSWKQLVPSQVGAMIEERGLFHCAQ